MIYWVESHVILVEPGIEQIAGRLLEEGEGRQSPAQPDMSEPLTAEPCSGNTGAC